MLNIAIVTETYPPEINGVAMTMGRLVSYLREQGHRVLLVRPRRGDLPPPEGDELRLPGMCVPGYPALRFGLPVVGRLSRAWRAFRPDVVHIVTEGPLGYAALHSARALNIPVSSGFHTCFDQYTRHYGLSALQGVIAAYLRHFHNRAHCTFAPGVATRQRLLAAGYRNVIQLDRGVDAGLFDPARRCARRRAEWGVEDDQPLVLNVGRLAAEKNLDLLFDAFAAVQQRWPRAQLVLVGDGPARAALQRAHPEAVFAGLRQGEDLAAHYASADLFLFPSLSETWGNVVVEAMASGLPVLAFDYAAPAQLIDSGVNGFLCPYQDRAAFLRQAGQLPALCALREMGARARARCAGMSWQAIGVAMEREFIRISHKPTLQGAVS